ncbi:MAG: MarC family protein [Holosporales bacterium]|jgi:multiple antibiotic resistance protein|nr:MarC family protein [Holosporales bacterium]
MSNCFVKYLIKLFFVVNPHIVVPFVLSCTQNYTNSERRATALKMCLFGLCLGVAFALCGNALLASVGISIPAFRIGGGILLAVAAWGLLYSNNTASSDSGAVESTLRVDISICPLAFPMLVGPATLTTLIGMIIESKAPGGGGEVLVLLALALIVGLTYVLTLFGSGLLRLLGRNGAIILEKLGGILLIAMSIEMLAGGIKAYFGL